jgi:asparagine synthase (glutamine-hydrolysing)
MCGIVGKISFSNIKKDDIKLIEQFSDAIEHRGPDAKGIYSNDDIVFGHRRLSIIDTSINANQPMYFEDESLVIVFNGEIYNHQDIREELENKYIFKTDHSDTETLMYAYKEWGIKCIDKFNGFFAIAIYDKVLEKVFLVRDRLGKKPLYYIKQDNTILFSSEIKSFFSTSEKIIKKEISEEAIYHYLTFLTVNAPNTFYKNVFKLEAGYYLEINKLETQKVKYWDIADYINTTSTDTYDEAVIKTEDILDKSMQYRNIADVKVSVALSGGLDSSLNLYYANNYKSNLSNAINISYSTKSEFDESEVAEQFSKEQKTNFIKSEINSEDLENLIGEYLKIQQDIPLGSPDTVLIYLLSKISKKENSKVLLVGEGGDEIGGYPIYSILEKEYKILRYVKYFSFIFKYLPSKIARRLDFFYKNRVISRRQVHGFCEYEKEQFWLGNKKYNSYKILDKYMNEIKDNSSNGFLKKVLNIEYKLRLPELIVARVDYASMASSIEARSPFLDHKLMEYSASLPFNVKMKNGAKSIIKDIAEDKLPDYILDHPKVGFGMLLKPFLADTMPIWYKEELLRNDNILHKYIDKDYLIKLYDEHLINKAYGYKMWILFALSQWIKVNKFDS